MNGRGNEDVHENQERTTAFVVPKDSGLDRPEFVLRQPHVSECQHDLGWQGPASTVHDQHGHCRGYSRRLLPKQFHGCQQEWSACSQDSPRRPFVQSRILFAVNLEGNFIHQQGSLGYWMMEKWNGHASVLTSP